MGARTADASEDPPAAPAGRRRTPTTTSAFGVGRREGHDASAFYARFTPPAVSDDDTVVRPAAVDTVWVGDARDMDVHGSVADRSVALVVTSPPYFAGKEYEQAMGVGHVPADFADYLTMLHDVFGACFAKLEPGGRIAVNVANLGRKPYRSLAADVVGILEGLGYLLRGEIVWQKSHAAGGSCAWGTYQRPGNPVLRDVSERIVVASKGRFDRAVPAEVRRRTGLPHQGTVTKDEFVDATTDVWDLPAESATRVGHPAPFPVELPRRLIELYTYRGDLVLDPFMGSGSTAVAAVRTERHFVGFDTDPDYVALTARRVAAEREALDPERRRVTVAPPRTGPRADGDGRGAGGRPWGEGPGRRRRVAGRGRIHRPGGRADDRRRGRDRRRAGPGRIGADVAVPVHRGVLGHPTRTPAPRRAVARARDGVGPRRPRRAAPGRDDLGPLVVLSTDVPPPRSPGARALGAVVGPDLPIVAVCGLSDPHTPERLAAFASGSAPSRWVPRTESPPGRTRRARRPGTARPTNAGSTSSPPRAPTSTARPRSWRPSARPRCSTPDADRAGWPPSSPAAGSTWSASTATRR